MNASEMHIKKEDELCQTGDLDAARGRFELALQGLQYQKDDFSDTENESDTEVKSQTVLCNKFSSQSTRTRPLRKRRRKEVDVRDSGFHHTFVMRMFDRSVDLAQFTENSPLYPVCRAWMQNQPLSSNVAIKTEPASPSQDMVNHNDSSDGSEIAEESSDKISNLPSPDPWPLDVLVEGGDLRIPRPLPCYEKKLEVINQEEYTLPSVLLQENLNRWKKVSNSWRKSSQINVQRYSQSYKILKSMFDKAHDG